MKCFIDGNALCIVKDDFVNLQESESCFIELSEGDIVKIKELEVK